MMMENIHNETYSLLIHMYIKEKKKQNETNNVIETMPAIGAKAKWAEIWCNSQHASFAKTLVTLAAVEGIFFSSSSCATFWFKQHGVLPGLFCK
jgi:ribonucleoside-diphosphate reductase subunit M2